MNAVPARPRIVSREDWLAERLALLAREREVTHLRDAVAAERRQLPWVKVETPYVFQTPAGEKTLADLFGPRSQLAVYHFMLTPGSDHICPGCSFLCDHVDAARQHFENADLSFVAVSRAPLAQIEAARRRMGWTFDFVSSEGTSFNRDFGVQWTAEEVARGEASYNFATSTPWPGDLHGSSIFAKDEAGEVFHTYSAYARGNELAAAAMVWLDLTPKGRNENGQTMPWVRLHDEYADAPAHSCCGG